MRASNSGPAGRRTPKGGWRIEEPMHQPPLAAGVLGQITRRIQVNVGREGLRCAKS